jgi:hypothetical protein
MDDEMMVLGATLRSFPPRDDASHQQAARTALGGGSAESESPDLPATVSSTPGQSPFPILSDRLKTMYAIGIYQSETSTTTSNHCPRQFGVCVLMGSYDDSNV